ncbi:hypothetical protein CGRA01v4_03471 [Colletotrichum graminicola]|nr:hypothetical protein CGRA01v4_03471 [Colletotrichum graminicola]
MALAPPPFSLNGLNPDIIECGRIPDPGPRQPSLVACRALCNATLHGSPPHCASQFYRRNPAESKRETLPLWGIYIPVRW